MCRAYATGPRMCRLSRSAVRIRGRPSRKAWRFAGSSDPRGDGTRFLAPLLGEEDEAGFEPQPFSRGVRPGVQRKSTGLVAGNRIGLALANVLRHLFDGEVATGVLAHLGEVHRFHRVFLSGALRAPDATSPLNCCGG